MEGESGIGGWWPEKVEPTEWVEEEGWLFLKRINPDEIQIIVGWKKEGDEITDLDRP